MVMQLMGENLNTFFKFLPLFIFQHNCKQDNYQSNNVFCKQIWPFLFYFNFLLYFYKKIK